jgi:integrase
MTDQSSTTINRTLSRLPNAAYRPREYLTEAEVMKLIETARKRGRNGLRDSAAILLAYRHGLRAQELCQLRWSQIDLRAWTVACEQGEGWTGKRASVARSGVEGATSSARREPVCVRD